MWAFPEMEQVLEETCISKVAEGSERLQTQTQLFINFRCVTGISVSWITLSTALQLRRKVNVQRTLQDNAFGMYRIISTVRVYRSYQNSYFRVYSVTGSLMNLNRWKMKLNLSFHLLLLLFLTM